MISKSWLLSCYIDKKYSNMQVQKGVGDLELYCYECYFVDICVERYPVILGIHSKTSNPSTCVESYLVILGIHSKISNPSTLLYILHYNTCNICENSVIPPKTTTPWSRFFISNQILLFYGFMDWKLQDSWIWSYRIAGFLSRSTEEYCNNKSDSNDYLIDLELLSPEHRSIQRI